MVRRLAIVTLGALVLWLIVLVILGAALGARQERRTQERLAESLQGVVTIDASDLALIRGRYTLDGLSVRRADTIGHLSLDVAGVRCELLPVGGALFDRTCRELVVDGVRLEVSAAALFKVKKPKRRPLHADRIVITDAQFVFLANAIAPNIGRAQITIESAESGPTVFRTPLSWLFTLRELRAKLELPGDVALTLGYKAGVLTVAGSIFGSETVELPVQLPSAETAHDAQEEMQMLGTLGKDLAQQLVAKRAGDWVKSKLCPTCAIQPR